MKIAMTTAALVLATLPMTAQTDQLTGVSNPDNSAITSNDDSTQSVAQPAQSARRPLTADKPAAGTPAAVPTNPPDSSNEAYGAYVPYKGPGASDAQAATAPAKPFDPDAEIVTSVPEGEHELREGTLLHVRMEDQLSTISTTEGAKFSAEVMEPIEKDGRVIIPIGSVLNGQVTEVRSGKRISGAAALHLEPRDVTLPDGTLYILHAQLVDVSLGDLKVDGEGTLKRKDHPKETLAVIGLATGSGAVAGGMLGGGVGALVGGGIGAGVSTYLWLKSDRQATLGKDVRLVFSLTTPMELTPMKATGTPVAANAGGSE
jgi:hypothetical protein